MNYQELQQAIQNYTEANDSNFVANIPNFVIAAENIINNTVQLPAFRKNVTGETTQDFQYLNLPSDFLSSFSLAVIAPDGNYYYLLNKDVNYIREAFPYPGSPTGLPQYYALFSDQSMILGPTPDNCYVMEFHYYAYPPSITVAGTSWIGTNFPNALLYGSLYFAYGYLKGEQDLLQMYRQNFDEALSKVKRVGDGLDRQDAYRVTEVRDKVT